MKTVLLFGCFALALSNLQAADKSSGSASPEIRMKQAGADRVAFEVAGLPQKELDWLMSLDPESPRWGEVLIVRVKKAGSGSDLPAMLGTYKVAGKFLLFEPRFPLARGLKYQVALDRASIPHSEKSSARIEATFSIPKPEVTATTTVDKVFPTSSRLPENQLKFYLHFSAPMSRGEAYGHVHLLDENGKKVMYTFLELGEELWDPSGKRFTLFFDPGRIKRGLKPREELGPCLISGKSYTFQIDRGWADAEGNPLKENFTKKFTVTDPVDDVIDLKQWKLEPPVAPGSSPLTVRFPRPLDNALCQRMVWVTNDEGVRIEGTLTLSREETLWQFQPRRPWKAGKYQLRINKALEDLAGNSVAAPFEIDVFKPIQRESKAETAILRFDVR